MPAALAVVGVLLAIRFVWKRRESVRKMSGRTMALLLFGIAVAGMVVTAWWLKKRQNKAVAFQMQVEKQRHAERLALIEATRHGDLIALVGDVLEAVSADLDQSAERVLREVTISRIAALTYALKPYYMVEMEGNQRGKERPNQSGMSEKVWSPERGYLLLALANMDIDSASFRAVKATASFADADLRKANLRGRDLSGADLRGAGFKHADMHQVNLSDADLTDAQLWGAHLDSANLRRADFTRADLRWTEANHADFRHALLNGADLSNAHMRHADFRKSEIKWASTDGALLHHANLACVNMLGTHFIKTHLHSAHLLEANLRMTDMTDAYLPNAELTRVAVDKNWVEKMEEWGLKDRAAVSKAYEVVPDTSGRFRYATFCLHKLGDVAEILVPEKDPEESLEPQN
ncbi:MAG: pentapeptide repeat-containing protein [Bacteroidota bacterium]